MAEKGMLLPKNMRQMGEKEDRIKIYVEDYVRSYFQKLQLSAESWRVGVLLGMHQEREGIPCLFISGALETRAADFANGRLRFTDAAWQDILRRKEAFFPGTGICGWFVYEKSGGMVDKLSLKKTYEEAFAQGDKVLLLHDDDDQEAFYMLWKGGLDRMKGYYIYYERNEPMQAYMEAENKVEPPREEGREAVVQQFRARMEEMRKKGAGENRFRRRPARGTEEESRKSGPRLLTGLFPGGKEERENGTEMEDGAFRKRNRETEGERERKDAPEKKFLSESGWKQVRLAAACVAVLLVGVTFFNYREKLLGLEDAVSDLVSMENSTAEAGATVGETGESLLASSAAIPSSDASGSGEGAVASEEQGALEEQEGLEVTLPPDSQATSEGAETAGTVAPENTSASEETGAETAAPTETESSEQAAETAASPETSAPAETEPPEETDPPAETVAAVDPQSVSVDSLYRVADGETLSQICWRLYGTLEPMERFCQLNGIADPNRILTGQWLVLPE